MSNHSLTPKDDHHEIMVGWDPQLETYFLHIIDTRFAEDDWKRDEVWVGAAYREVEHVSAIVKLLDGYADISEDLVRTLIVESLE